MGCATAIQSQKETKVISRVLDPWLSLRGRVLKRCTSFESLHFIWWMPCLTEGKKQKDSSVFLSLPICLVGGSLRFCNINRTPFLFRQAVPTQWNPFANIKTRNAYDELKLSNVTQCPLLLWGLTRLWT